MEYLQDLPTAQEPPRRQQQRPQTGGGVVRHSAANNTDEGTVWERILGVRELVKKEVHTHGELYYIHG